MRYPAFGYELFQRNREKLIAKLDENSVAIVYSNDRMVRSGDQFYPYRQNSDLFYLTGIEQEMTVLMLYTGKKTKDEKSMLFLRKPDPEVETWEGKKLGKERAMNICGIRDVYWMEDFNAVARPLILKSRCIYCNVPEHEKFKPEYPLKDERMMMELKKEYPLHEFKRLAPLMAELRMVKEPEEVDLIRKAVEITLGGLNRVLAFIRPGLYEYEVEAELSHEFIRKGASGHAYPPIIASGGSACLLHYIQNDQVCRKGDLFLMDFGAEYANYAADCTRTVPVSGQFSQRQRQLYDATLRVLRGARALMKPGTTIDSINVEAGKLWEEEHVKLGLYTLKQARENKAKDPLYKKYFMHGVAHFLGLDVHDVGSRQAVLKPGMTLTCEPGIYLPEESIGIRLENNILITEKGNIDLMDGFPLEAGEIEERMHKKNP